MSVHIYNGPGVDRASACATMEQLENFVGRKREIKFISYEELSHNNSSWDNDGQLLVIPGGNATDIIKCFRDQEKGGSSLKHSLLEQRIRNFVLNKDKKYLGLCAGAFYASHEIAFKHDGESINWRKGLDLFQGCANTVDDFLSQPCSVKVIYPSDTSQKADQTTLKTAYISSATFEKISSKDSILATYEKGLPAMLSCQEGKVLLCGFHPELSAAAARDTFNRFCAAKAQDISDRSYEENSKRAKCYYTLPSKLDIDNWFNKLKDSDEQRKEFLREMMRHLSIAQ